MHGVKRVMIFCLLTTFIPIFLLVMPLYLRHKLYADVVYAVTESDIMEISDGVSTMFCSAHTLHMNSTFNAFQMGHKPEVTSYRKHIRLKKSMTLPDDTLEYWGFYLLRGATVALSVCSKSPGASILVVKGQRSLSTCGLLDHNQNKARRNGIFSPLGQNQVKITFETNAQLIESRETLRTSPRSSGVPRERKTPQKTLNISEDTLNRLSPSVQSYITDLITSHDLKVQKNENSKSERRVRHSRKKFRGKIREKEELEDENDQFNEENERFNEENPQKIDKKSSKKLIRPRRFIKTHEKSSKLTNSSRKKLIDHSTQKNYYFERTIDYFNKLNPIKSRSLVTQQKLEMLKSQLETPNVNTAAEEDANGEKIYITYKYKHREPPKDTHEKVVKRSQEALKPPALLDRGKIREKGESEDENDHVEDKNDRIEEENPQKIDRKSLKKLIRPRRFIITDENSLKLTNSSKKKLIDHSSTQKNYYFERTIDYINKLNPRKSRSLVTQQKLEMLKSQLETPDMDIAAEEDADGEKIYYTHHYKPPKPPKNTHKVVKRSQEPVKPPALLDRGIKHGGNAYITPQDSESSVSSFEDGLFDCYKGNVLLATKFPPTNCESVEDLLNGEIHMQTHHNVTEDGYYYYIFYSDNDFVSNDMHAVFDIWKPTFQYENVTKSCVNVTECTFPLEIMSGDRVIVEVPTRDGIEHEADDISLLVSTCHPRVGIYVIFPIAVLLFIISCAFL